MRLRVPSIVVSFSLADLEPEYDRDSCGRRVLFIFMDEFMLVKPVDPMSLFLRGYNSEADCAKLS